MIRYAIRYEGTVQGVGFRATTSSVAERHPVTGWVRNEPDGSVRLECQGVREDVDAMLAALDERIGHLVTDRRVETVPANPGESDFEIRR